MSDTMAAILVAAISFGLGMAAAILVKTIHLEKKEHDRKDPL